MSLLHEFCSGTDLGFVVPSSTSQPRFLFSSSRSSQYHHHQSTLPERALLRPGQLPNTPVASSGRGWTRHRAGGPTTQRPFNEDDDGVARRRRWTNTHDDDDDDDRLPVVQLHPFERNEWRPSNSIPLSVSSISSVSNSSSSSASMTSSNNLLTRSMTSIEIAKREKKMPKRLGCPGESSAMEFSLSRQRTKTSLAQDAEGVKGQQQQLLKNHCSPVNRLNRRSTTFLLPQPSTFHPTADLSPRVVLPSNNHTTTKPAPRAIRRATTTIASGPVRLRSGKRISLTGTAFCLSSRSSTLTSDSARWNSTIRESGRTRSQKDPSMSAFQSTENDPSKPGGIAYHRATTTFDSTAAGVLPVRTKRSRQTEKGETSYDQSHGRRSVFHVGVTGEAPVEQRRTIRPTGFESQLTSLLRVTIDEMRRTQPNLCLVNGLPKNFLSYGSLVESTYGEERIRSGIRQNAPRTQAEEGARTRRTGAFVGGARKKKNHIAPAQQPTSNYTLPNLFHFLENETDRDGDRDRGVEEEGKTGRHTEAEQRTEQPIVSEEKMTYNSRRTSSGSGSTPGGSAAGEVAMGTDVAVETDVAIETDVALETDRPDGEWSPPPPPPLPLKGSERIASALSSVSFRSVTEKTEILRLTVQDEDESLETVARETELIATVPTATTPKVNAPHETETMGTHSDHILSGGESTVDPCNIYTDQSLEPTACLDDV